MRAEGSAQAVCARGGIDVPTSPYRPRTLTQACDQLRGAPTAPAPQPAPAEPRPDRPVICPVCGLVVAREYVACTGLDRHKPCQAKTGPAVVREVA